MLINTPFGKAARLIILVLLALAVIAGSARAKDVPDSINTIQSILPDSISTNGKVVYVDFWASWCVPCRHSFPWMQTLYSKYHDTGLEIIAVNVDKDHKAAMDFITGAKITFPVVFDSTGILAEQYGLEAMPTSFIYGRDGRLKSQHLGFWQEKADSLDTAIAQLLNEKGAK